PLSSIGSQAPACAYFLRGRCRFGDQCREFHPSSDSALSAAPLSNIGTKIIPCAHFLRGHCRFGDQCREFHPSPNPSASVEAPTRPPCQYFNRGSCIKGNNCPFSHEGGDVLSAERAESLVNNQRTMAIPIIDVKALPFIPSRGQFTEAEPVGLAALVPQNPAHLNDIGADGAYASTDRTIYNCNVHFGAGAAVLQIITPFESRRVLISNIPASSSDAVISTVLSRLTSSAELQIHRSPLAALATATLIFPDASSASQAASIVSAISIEGKMLSGQLDLRAYATAEEGKGVLRGRKVKLTWYGRRGSAFVHYFSARSAEEHARRLDGKSFHGYILSASFRRPTPPPTLLLAYGRRSRPSTQLYTVMIRNLPLVTSKIELQGFCQAESVAVDPPRCPEDSPIRMRQALEEFGPVEAFDTLPMTKASAKVIAFAQFQDAGAAAAAESALRAGPPSFLSGTPFFIERTFSVKYSVRQDLFAKLQGTLDLLAGHHPSMIRYYLGENLNEPVVVVLHGSEPKMLGRVKTELDRIVQGELFVVEGQKIWDDFFDGVEGQTFLDSLNLSENVFIRCDTRTRTIRLFGPEAERVQARNLILQKVADVRARRHVFPLRKDLIRLLLRQKLRQLQESLGTDCLVLDVVARTLTVNGDDSVIRRVHAELVALESGKTSDSDRVATNSDTECPVCFCPLEDLVRLDCGHAYCRDCLQHYLRPAAQDPSFSPRQCVAEVLSLDAETPGSTGPCGLAISYSIIRSLLTSAEEDSLLRASFLAYINEHPAGFRYCPSPDCEMVYHPSKTGTAFQCPSCLLSICPACNVEYHDGISCTEHQDNLNGGLAALEKWREKNGVKQCPNCHADIEKAGGCNHMTCFFCKTHICWVCLKTFADEDSARGVYAHMQKEHGGFSS
ncbi:hypothetical protein B0H19DRAFT_1352780, partial [Mycena capillaripes]